ncbi:hypothetical protein INR49_009480 [Caranx melampygus]|nr:hypothetical protein INR49_009480 [Caranx melampygus]
MRAQPNAAKVLTVITRNSPLDPACLTDGAPPHQNLTLGFSHPEVTQWESALQLSAAARMFRSNTSLFSDCELDFL